MNRICFLVLITLTLFLSSYASNNRNDNYQNDIPGTTSNPSIEKHDEIKKCCDRIIEIRDVMAQTFNNIYPNVYELNNKFPNAINALKDGVEYANQIMSAAKKIAEGKESEESLNQILSLCYSIERSVYQGKSEISNKTVLFNKAKAEWITQTLGYYKDDAVMIREQANMIKYMINH